MSVDTQVLGASTIAGGGGAATATLADTGDPMLVGVVVGVALIITLSIVSRLAKR